MVSDSAATTEEPTQSLESAVAYLLKVAPKPPWFNTDTLLYVQALDVVERILARDARKAGAK